jgi:amino-acid N-acetyltransferase
MLIEKLTDKNIESLYKLIKVFSDEYLLLPKSLDEIKDLADSFIVVKADQEIIACAMLDQFTDTLAEVRTLAVAKEHQRKGLGKLLVKDCEARAKSLGVKRVFALTYEENFFHQLGYKTVDRNSLPEKVLKTCIHCSQYSNCQEIAVIKDL